MQLGRTLLLFTDADERSSVSLADDVDIVGRVEDEGSRIVKSVSHESGSEIFAPPDAAESPWLARARSNLQIMYRTALAVSHTLDIDQLLARIMDMIFEWVEADRGCIMLVDARNRASSPLRPAAIAGACRPTSEMTISRTILDYVVEHNEGVLTSDARDDERWDAAESIVKLGVREAICVPMQGRYDVVGVIYIDTYTPPGQIAASSGHRQQVHRRAPQADDRHRPPGGAGGRRHVVLHGDGAGRAAGGRGPDDRHALAPHQEHPARHSRRQLPDRGRA